MTDYVRIKTESGGEASVSREFAESIGVKPLDPKDHPAVDVRGQVLDPTEPEYDPDAPTGYNALNVDALKSEIDRRNENLDPAGALSKSGNKDALVATLEAADQAAAANPDPVL